MATLTQMRHELEVKGDEIKLLLDILNSRNTHDSDISLDSGLSLDSGETLDSENTLNSGKSPKPKK